MKVWLVFHADIEDDRYVRGIFATKELAEAVVTLDETTVYGAGLDPKLYPERIGVRHHGDYCCIAEATEVRDQLPETFVLNPQPPLTGPGLFAVSLGAVLEELWRRDFPLFDKMRAGVIGKVDRVEETPDGIRVEATLDDARDPE